MVNSPTQPMHFPSVLRGMRLAQLQLVRMAGHGANFREMADALHVTQPAITKMAKELERALGTRVRIVELTDQRGRIEIEYYSQVELDRLYTHIVGDQK